MFATLIGWQAFCVWTNEWELEFSSSTVYKTIADDDACLWEPLRRSINVSGIVIVFQCRTTGYSAASSFAHPMWGKNILDSITEQLGSTIIKLLQTLRTTHKTVLGAQQSANRPSTLSITNQGCSFVTSFSDMVTIQFYSNVLHTNEAILQDAENECPQWTKNNSYFMIKSWR